MSRNSDRKMEDSDRIQLLLHKISCDDVSVEQFVRLGAPRTAEDSGPRSVESDLLFRGVKKSCTKAGKKLEENGRAGVDQSFYPSGLYSLPQRDNSEKSCCSN